MNRNFDRCNHYVRRYYTRQSNTRPQGWVCEACGLTDTEIDMACDPSFKHAPLPESYNRYPESNTVPRPLTNSGYWANYFVQSNTHGEPSSPLGERRIPNMASGQKIVYVPDRSNPMYFDGGLTTEEIKSALVSTGYTAVQNSEARISTDGQTIRFERVTGGSKGL